MSLAIAVLSASLTGCQQFQPPEPGPVEAADQPVTQRFSILAVDQPQSELLTALQRYADVTFGDFSAVGSYDAMLIEAGDMHHDDLAAHQAVQAALLNDKIIIVTEPTKAHNEALVHRLAGLSSTNEMAALAVHRVFDADGRAHFAIVYGEADSGGTSGGSSAAAYANFAATLHDYVVSERAKLIDRVSPAPVSGSAKARNVSSDSDGSTTLAAPAGSLYRHVFVYTAPARGVNMPYTWDWDFDKKYVDTKSLNSITSELAKQTPSHSVKNHWYFYHNDPRGGGDFAGIDTYIIILEQDCQFSPGTPRWTSGSSLGYFQDHFTVLNEAGTWSPNNPNQFIARAMDLEDTSPANVNQTTNVTTSHETSISKSLSVGISADGLSAGASVTQTETFGTSTSRDISDWGILNQSDPGTGNSQWVFHQQMPNDRYLGDKNVWNKSTAKQPPALSMGSNSQDMITMWTTLGLPVDEPLSGAYHLAFRTTVNQYLLAQARPVVSNRLFGFGGTPFSALFYSTLTSQQNWRVTLNDQFLNGD